MTPQNDSQKPEGRFYVDHDLSAPSVLLPDEEAAHVRKVRRIRSGSPVELFNGRGGMRSGRLEGRRVVFTEALRTAPAPASRLTLAVSPPKGDRMTFLVEKLSELGADVLIPTVFERSVDAGVTVRTAKIGRWRRTAVEAAKQCGRAFLLEVCEPMSLLDLQARVLDFDHAVLLAPGGVPFERVLAAFTPLPRSVLILVGPEGGITSRESADLGLPCASLGTHILRIETAAVAAAAIYNVYINTN
jgi:16S rRNA (uracil1498-N3)-methyltransferase